VVAVIALDHRGDGGLLHVFCLAPRLRRRLGLGKNVPELAGLSNRAPAVAQKLNGTCGYLATM
jgi:hypothetical protein